MELFATDLERLAFLLEADAALTLDPDALGTEAAEQSAPEELPPEKRPKYITNYIGSKQKLVDWIWKHTPEGVGTVLDAFSGSAVVAYMYKTKGLQVIANDRLRYCHHAASPFSRSKAWDSHSSARCGMAAWNCRKVSQGFSGQSPQNATPRSAAQRVMKHVAQGP